MNHRELEEILKQVPEARLRVLELAERLVNEDGRLPKKLTPEQLQEMRNASVETTNYVHGVQRLIAESYKLFHPSR